MRLLPATDAVTFVEKYTQRPWQRVVFCLLFLFPIIGNFVARFSKHGWWLNDFDALICGADHVRRGLSPYGLDPVCEGTRPAIYVYAPQVAKFFAPMTTMDIFGGGLGAARIVWWLPCILAMGVLFWYAIAAPAGAVPQATSWRLRLMTLAAIVGSAFACGNIGIVLHGLVTAMAVFFARRRWPFILMVVLATLIKPVMLTYLVLLLFEKRSMIERLAGAAIGSIAGLAAIGVEMLTAGTLSDEWHRTLNLVVLTQQPGISYFGWLGWIGVPNGPAGIVLAGALMLATLAAGWVLAESQGGDTMARIAVGLGMAQFLNPRLMDYDMLALAPIMMLGVVSARSLDTRLYRIVSWSFVLILCVDVLANLLEIKGFNRSPVTLFIYWIMLLSVSACLWRKQERPEGLPGVLKAIWRERAAA